MRCSADVGGLVAIHSFGSKNDLDPLHHSRKVIIFFNKQFRIINRENIKKSPKSNWRKDTKFSLSQDGRHLIYIYDFSTSEAINK